LTSTAVAWYRDRGVRRLIAFRYVPWLAVLSLAWEIGHVPLYTLWTEAEPHYIAFAVLHCTVGDVLIGAAAILLALITLREGSLAHWRWGRIAALSVLFGVAYTVLSEWMNVTVLRSWAYAPSMPGIELGDFQLGLTPLLQWIVIPPVTLCLARKNEVA
jgi:hypothetical protein